jgi:hypothetical protein
MKEIGRKICNMEKVNSFILIIRKLFKDNLCMGVNLVKENIIFLMVEFIKDIFIMDIVMVLAN